MYLSPSTVQVKYLCEHSSEKLNDHSNWLMKTIVANEQNTPANFGGDSGGNSSDIRSRSSSTPLASPLLLGTISLEEYSKPRLH